MATPFDSIYDFALVSFKDWRLDKLYQTNPSSFEIVMQGLLLKAIPKFQNCNVNLYNYDLILKQFIDTLDLDTQVILSNFLILEWFETQINDARENAVLVNDTDFNVKNQNTVIRERADLRDKFREMNERELLKYNLKNVDWQKLINGDYYNV